MLLSLTRNLFKRALVGWALLTYGFMASSCSDDLSVLLQDADTFSISVISLDRASGVSGETVSITGRNLINGLQLKINSVEQEIDLFDQSSAKFVLPSSIEHYLITLTYADKVVGEFKIQNTDVVLASVSDFVLCSEDAQIRCIANTNFKAVQIDGLADKVKFGETVAGVSGAVTLPAAGDVISGSGAYGSPDSLVTPSYLPDFPAASNVRSSDTVNGSTGTLPDCGSDNGTGCVATASHPSVVKLNITAGLVKSGTVIAGVTGGYPSSAYPLATGDLFNDLDSATFDAKLKDGATTFGWFDRNGSRFTATGDSDIAEVKIKSGISVFGTLGTYAPPCSGDAQTDCVTTSTFKSVNTNAITTWDIRLGKTAGGISGSLVFNKNASDLTRFNRTASTGSDASTTVADFYDSIDDYNNNGTLPSTLPTGWTNSVNQWIRDPLSDNGNGGGTASNGLCDGTEACVYQDRISGLYWLKDDGQVGRDWEASITYCEGLSAGGYSDWRLPTQKIMMQAYINSIWSIKTELNLSTLYYSTSTTWSQGTAYAWWTRFYHGGSGTGQAGSTGDKTLTTPRAICVR